MTFFKVKRPVRMLLFALLVTYGCLSSGSSTLWAQGLGNERVIIGHYKAEEDIPNGINDCAFDSQGKLWLIPENENLRVFDGINVRMLPAPLIKGIPHFEFAGVMQNSAGRLFFLDLFKTFLFQVGKTGQLYYDSVSTSSALPVYSSYHYFDWDRLADLKKRLSANETFTPFDDSTFIFREGDSCYLYKDHRLRPIKGIRFDVRNGLVLNNELIVKETGRFVLVGGSDGNIGGPDGNIREVALSGDILADSLYGPYVRAMSLHKSMPDSISLFRSRHPHIVFNNRLYRIQLRDRATLGTIFVCDLRFLHHPISKVEYNPQHEVTALCTKGEGLYLIRRNPFYNNLIPGAFREIRKRHIFYPLTLKNKTTFFTSWCEFSGDGYYKLLDSAHRGPRCLFTDHNGKVWEGTENEVILYDQNMVKERKITIPEPNRKTVDICENDRREIICLTDGSLLIYKEGMFRDLKPGFTHRSSGLKFEQFRFMGDGKYWLASNKGLYVYDQHLNSIDKFDSIPDVYTQNITKLSDGSILFACYPVGYYFIYYKNQFFKILVNADLSLREMESLIEDRRGRIWFATINGLFVTTKEEIEAYCDKKKNSIYYYKYGNNDGLQEVEFNGGLNPSNCISGDGYLVFTSMSGVFAFHQDSVRQEFPGKDIQLATLLKSGEEIYAEDTIALDHKNDGLVIQVGFPYYGSKENLQMEYRISPGMDAWKEVDPKGRISLGHLSHGAWLLSVRVRAGLGPWDYLTRTTTIQVKPLFYETWLFKAIAAVALILICTVVTIAIVLLRKEVRMKNISLHDKNARLQQALSELEENISLKEKLISLILHDLKTPLYFQSLLFNQIVEGDYFATKEAREIFLELKKSSAGILQFTKEFLTWYSSQRDGFKVKKTTFDPMLIVKDLFSVYAGIAAKKGLALQCESSGIQSLHTDRNILEIIIRNLLDNAIKYTSTGSVTLLFERRAEGHAIIVMDTGKGMTADRIKMLEGYSGIRLQQSSLTFGYRFIYTMAKKIDATIHIASEAEKGTSVTIVIPAGTVDSSSL